MSLPLSRNTTYSPGSPIFSVDLNAMQDAIVGKKHGLIRRSINLTQFSTLGSVWQSGQANAQGGICSTTLGSSATFMPDYEVGDEIMGLELFCSSNGTAGTKGLSCGIGFNRVGLLLGVVTPGVYGFTNIVASASTTQPASSVPLPTLFTPPLTQSWVMASGDALQMFLSATTTVGFVITVANLLVRRP